VFSVMIAFQSVLIVVFHSVTVIIFCDIARCTRSGIKIQSVPLALETMLHILLKLQINE
jgi:hypothetical protein